jgi:hypothetical protein
MSDHKRVCSPCESVSVHGERNGVLV